jgi:predicted glycoside hydrolase/deacetylase ChbG (UPF0249 family)
VSQKILVINADDLGLSPNVNAAIENLHRSGMITDTTLMVDEKHVDDALAVIRRNPRLGIGLHLDLCPIVGFYTRPYAQMREELQQPASLAKVADEVDRQIVKFRGLGLEFRHMDGHRHFHALPEIFATVVDVAAAHGLKSMRFAQNWILPRTPSVYLDETAFKNSMELLGRRGIAFAQNWIIGWRGFSAADVIPGWNELMVHVGYDDQIYQREFNVLASEAWADALRESGIQLKSFVELPQA